MEQIAEESLSHTQPPLGTIHIANRHRAILENVERARSSCNQNSEPDLYFLLTLILGQYLIHCQVAHVVNACRNQLRVTNEIEIPIFLGGGGKTSSYYRDTILSTHETFNWNSSGFGRFRMLDVPVPNDLAMNGIARNYFHRFGVAYGLSIPDYDLLNSKLPSALPILIPPRPRQKFVPDSAQDDG